MTRKRPTEPSMNLIRRLGDLNPARLAAEVQRLRQERDALRDSLSMKLSAHVATMSLQPDDVLLVRKHGKLDPVTAGEALAGLADRLRQRYSWEGAIIMLNGHDEVVVASPAETEALLEKIRARAERA